MATQMTETAIGKARKEAKGLGAPRTLADAGCPGLRLRVSPRGTATWLLAMRDPEGRMRSFTFGRFPALGVSEARDRARTLHGEVRHAGADPVAVRRKQRQAAAAARVGVGTLGAILDLYGKHAGAELKSWPEGRKRIEKVFAKLLQRPVEALTAAAIQLEADSYAYPKSAAFAVRTLRPVLKWGAKRGYLPAEAASLSSPAVIRARRRVLSAAELAAILPVLKASDRPYGAALRFMLLTLCRRAEATGARWRDVDLSTGAWTLPVTKNGETHLVPLPWQAIELLQGVRPEEPEPDALVFVTSTGAALGNWDRETKIIQAASKTAGWGRHDLRRTGATMLGDLGVTPDIIEAALNHVSIRSALAASYNRSRYRPQVAAALQRLADQLDGIEAGEDKIVPLRKPGA